MASKPKYYSKRIKLFVAIAPAVLFEHVKEQKFIDLAEQEMAQTFALHYNYLEYDGNLPHKDDFIYYIKENYPSLCDKPEFQDFCNEQFNTRESIELSPSVNLAYTDPDRLDVYM